MDSVYNDQENNVYNFRKLRSHSNVNRKSENQVMKRSVLGVINADSNKIAPTKSKNEVTQRTIPAKGPTYKNANSFKIFEDKEETASNADKKRNDKCKKESPSKKFKDCLSSVLELPPKLISSDLQSRQPLKDVFNASISSEDDSLSGKSYIESPMSVDKTLSPIARPKSMLKKLYDCDLYSEEILNYLKTMEKLYRAKPNYMRRQPDVSYTMRTILVDWLVEVAEEYKLTPQTLFLAVSFIDRFLSLMSVVRSKLQLLGTAAMFVASKYEEIYPPDVGEFVFITDDTYSQKQVLRMEYLILKVLAFDISGPTVITFVQHFSVLCDVPEKVLHLTSYLCELMLLEGDPYLAFHNSMLAASALLLSRFCLEYSEIWPENYAKITGYEMTELASCIIHLNTTHANAKTLQQQAVFNKYNTNKFLNVSNVAPKCLDVHEYLLKMAEPRRFGRNKS